MALIIDPDLLNTGEIVYDATAKTIQLIKTGNLSDDGVTLQAVYSHAKESWKDGTLDANSDELIKFRFPFVPITPEQFEFVQGWKPADQTTIDLIRNSGFAIKNNDGTSGAEYAGVITLGELEAGSQVYFQQAEGGASSNIVLTGQVNQCVQVYGDAANGDFDYRGYLKLFVREQAKKYAQADLNDIGVSQMTYQAYRFPLANDTDLKVTHDDTTADAYSVSITYHDTPVTKSIGGTDYDFDITIDGGGVHTLEEIYEYVQSALRKNADIDAGAGTVIGVTTDELLEFVGDTLVTNPGAGGVFIDNFLSVDTNRQELYDAAGTKVTYPFVAAGTLLFNDIMVDDGQGRYAMFYADNFGSSAADLVEDADGNSITGDVTQSAVSFSYDYDGDTAGGGASIDKNVVVVAIGLDGAQYVYTTATLTRTTQNTISLVSALERNYDNPV